MQQQREKNPSRQRERGMTLIEIMVVLMILGLIIGLVAVNVMPRFWEAQRRSTEIQIKNLESALDLFKLNCGFYPSTEQGLEALVSPPGVGRQCKNYSPEGYIKNVPLDPWKNPYYYISPGSGGRPYEIISLGADGVQGGEGDNADISSSSIQ